MDEQITLLGLLGPSSRLAASQCGERSLEVLRGAAFSDAGLLGPEGAFQAVNTLLPSPSFARLEEGSIVFGIAGESVVKIDHALLVESFARRVLAEEVMWY